jgi:hypothetical protein
VRQKDFNEVARLLGNEARTCPSNEEDGIHAANEALLGHAKHAYPDVNLVQMWEHWQQGRTEGM